MTLGWYSKFLNILEDVGGLWCCLLFPLNALGWAPFFCVGWEGTQLHNSLLGLQSLCSQSPTIRPVPLSPS